MGSPCALHLHGAAGEAALPLAVAEVERLEAKYSRYRDESLASEINRSAGDPTGVLVDEETAALLDYAQSAWGQSGGLFDPTSGVLRRAWDFGSGRLPGQAELDELLFRVGWGRLRWERPRLVLPVAGMELDFGGFVKEYAADRVAALCRRAGVRGGLVDLGGDLAVVGPHPDGSAWRVGIRHPARPGAAMATLDLVAGGVASSGDYERCMVVDGRRYGHILDPRSGWPVEGIRAVSVVASHCLVAGSVSTIAMLKGAAAPAWLREVGARAVWMGADGGVQSVGSDAGSGNAITSGDQPRVRSRRERSPASTRFAKPVT